MPGGRQVFEDQLLGHCIYRAIGLELVWWEIIMRLEGQGMAAKVVLRKPFVRSLDLVTGVNGSR